MQQIVIVFPSFVIRPPSLQNGRTMNRMWVRLSLAFTAVIIVVALVIGIAARLALEATADPEREVPAEVREYILQVREERGISEPTSLAIIVGAIAIVAGVWMSRILTAPLAELGEAAQAIGRQDLSRRVSVHGTEEVQAVATRFNEMAEILQEEEMLRRNLFADVAHELRNPLHILQGNLQAMLDGVYPLSEDEIARLVDQTRHLTRLVDDLHELAQAEAHQLALDRQETDMAALIKETTGAIQPVAAAKEVEVRVELLGAIPTLNVDMNRIRQALSNLLSNALRHTPADGLITIAAEVVIGDFEVRVSDTGPGIAPEHLERLFDRFYRTDSARTREIGGTGLGLAITRAIVEEHGGRVTVKSPADGIGSTFTIHLPITF